MLYRLGFSVVLVIVVMAVIVIMVTRACIFLVFTGRAIFEIELKLFQHGLPAPFRFDLHDNWETGSFGQRVV